MCGKCRDIMYLPIVIVLAILRFLGIFISLISGAILVLVFIFAQALLCRTTLRLCVFPPYLSKVYVRQFSATERLCYLFGQCVSMFLFNTAIQAEAVHGVNSWSFGNLLPPGMI